MFKRVFMMLALICTALAAWGQQPLFTVGGSSVYAGDFLDDNPEFRSLGDTSGLCEALGNYADFRAEVCEARRLRLDTTARFRRAMRYHRVQQYAAHIASSPKAQKIFQDMIGHSQYQYLVSYIRMDIYANGHGDTANAYGKAKRARSMVAQGQDFEEVARQLSDDPAAKINGGYLGWVSPFDIKAGSEVCGYIFSHFADSSEISQPIRSGQSFYIVKAGGRRAAIDTVAVSPILIRKKMSAKANDSLRRLARDISSRLAAGQDFGALQMKHSDIKFSETLPLAQAYAKYSTHLLDGAESAMYSPVIETSDYFCIAKIEYRHPMEAGRGYRRMMARQMAGSATFKEMGQYFLDSIKSISGYSQKGTLQAICRMMPDSAIFDACWKPGDLRHLRQILFTFGGKDYSLADFAEYLEKNQYKTGYSKIPEYVNKRYNDYVNQLAIAAAYEYLISRDQAFKKGMAMGERQALFSILTTQAGYPRGCPSPGQAMEFYRESGMDLKTSHTVTMRLYDYRSAQGRKKAARIASAQPFDSAAASEIASLSLSGTFTLGMNSVADEIISGFDSGKYTWPGSRVIFADSIHSFAVISAIKEPEPLSDDEICSIVAPMCARKMRQEWIEGVRSRNGLAMEPDACAILQKELGL